MIRFIVSFSRMFFFSFFFRDDYIIEKNVNSNIALRGMYCENIVKVLNFILKSMSAFFYFFEKKVKSEVGFRKVKIV